MINFIFEIRNIYILLVLSLLYSEDLTNSTQINISKTWSQEPLGCIYPIDINVPNIDTIIPDPAMVDPITGEPLGMEGEMDTMGDVPAEPEPVVSQKQMGADTKRAEI